MVPTGHGGCTRSLSVRKTHPSCRSIPSFCSVLTDKVKQVSTGSNFGGRERKETTRWHQRKQKVCGVVKAYDVLWIHWPCALLESGQHLGIGMNSGSWLRSWFVFGWVQACLCADVDCDVGVKRLVIPGYDLKLHCIHAVFFPRMTGLGQHVKPA